MVGQYEPLLSSSIKFYFINSTQNLVEMCSAVPKLKNATQPMERKAPARHNLISCAFLKNP
jgi:hypothetical protein